MLWSLKALEGQHARQYSLVKFSRGPKLLTNKPQFQILLLEKTYLNLIGWNKSVTSVIIAENRKPYPLCIDLTATITIIPFSQI